MDRGLATLEEGGILKKNKKYMKKMNRNEWIAVAVSLALMAFLFYGGAFVGLFNQSNNSQVAMPTDALTGVQTEDSIIGTGDIAQLGDTVSVNYAGALTNGQVFDSSYNRGEPITFTLGIGQVIMGWDQGIAGMRVGGKRRLTISPEYGYGSQAYGPIPANSTLVFDVELVGVKHPTSTPTALIQ